MRLFKARFFLISAVLFLLSCDEAPTGSDQDDTGIRPVITINPTARTYWFTDSLFESFLYPSIIDCVPGQPCLIVSTGAWDYTCTVFPDTFWGIIRYDIFPAETLYCHSDTCWVRNDSVVYNMAPYFQSKANAICSESAKAYTRIGVCYQYSTGEDTVRIHNACFDTTFVGVSSFCLPKLPLDSTNGVWIETIDTVFCPASVINGYDDFFTVYEIKAWVQ